MTTHNEVHPCLTQLSEIPPPAQLHSSQYCVLSFVPSNDRDNRFERFRPSFLLLLLFPSRHHFVSLKASASSDEEDEQMHMTARSLRCERTRRQQTDAQQLIYMKQKESERFLSRAVRDVPGTVCFALLCLVLSVGLHSGW